ncbi:unnamed protein product, partial [Closterium sp. NIES-64]
QSLHLITHLRTSDARFRAAMPAEFLASNPPPLWLTLYHLVTRLPDTLRTGCSPSPLLPSVASAAAVDLLGAEQVGSASAPSGPRSGKGRGGKGGGVDGGGGGGGGGGSGGGGGGAGGASGSGGGGGGSGGSGGRGGAVVVAAVVRGRRQGAVVVVVEAAVGGRGGSGTGQSAQHPQSSQELRQLSAPCSCRSLAHKTVLWHHRLGHPSVQRLRGMHARYLVSGLPRVLPPLPPSLAPPCLPCVEGRQRAAPHSSSFPPTTAPLQTLHMDVWGPARVRGQGQERYFLIVVDDYSRYTPRSSPGAPRVKSLIGGEFSSDLLAAYCAEHGIRQSFTLPASPQQNGVAKRRIGLVMEVARTSLVPRLPPTFCGRLRSGAAVVDPLPPQGAAPSGVSQVDPVEPAEVAVDSRPAGGAEPERAEPERAEPERAEPGVLSLGVLILGLLSLGVLSLVVLQLTVRRLETSLFAAAA